MIATITIKTCNLRVVLSGRIIFFLFLLILFVRDSLNFNMELQRANTGRGSNASTSFRIKVNYWSSWVGHGNVHSIFDRENRRHLQLNGSIQIESDMQFSNDGDGRHNWSNQWIFAKRVPRYHFFLIEIKSNCKWGRPIQAVIIQFWVMAGFWNYPAGQSFCIFRLLPVTDTFFFFEISNISTGSVRNCSIINVPCVCVRAQAICTWMPLSRSIMNNRSSNWEIHCFFFFYDC